MNIMRTSLLKEVTSSDLNVAFAKGMILPHKDATERASLELIYGKDPESRPLVQEVIYAKNKELIVMDSWLKIKQFITYCAGK